jgi:hypothetical protein
MKVVRDACRQLRDFDELLDVDEVLAAVWGGHSGRELQLDEPRHGEEREFLAAKSDSGGVGESDWFRLVVAGKATGAEYVDVHSMLRVAELAGARDALFVTFAQVSCLKRSRCSSFITRSTSTVTRR